jgi:hypothetical protein
MKKILVVLILMFTFVISNAQPDTINKDNVYIVLEQFMFYNNINDAAIDTSLVKDTVLVQLDTEQILICDFTYTFDLNNNTIFKLSPIGIVSKQYKNIKRLKYKYYTDVEFASMLNLKIKEKLCQLRKDLITGNINKPLGNKKSLSAAYDFTVLNDKINSLHSVNENLTIEINTLTTQILVLDQEISKQDSKIVILKKQTNEKVNNVDSYRYDELEQFFTERYRQYFDSIKKTNSTTSN